jgi:hypothetical protein
LVMMLPAMGASSMLREIKYHELRFLHSSQDIPWPASVLPHYDINYNQFHQYPVIGPKAYSQF